MTDTPKPHAYTGIYGEIIDRVYTRQTKYPTTPVEILPSADWMDEALIFGAFSRVGLSSKRRFLLNDILQSVDGTRESPSALARDYLHVRYGRGPFIASDQAEAIEVAITENPMYSKPTKFEEGFYIDLPACYWNFMLRVGWDVDYWPGRWLALNSEPPVDFPFPENKIARNALVSVGMSTAMTISTKDGTIYEIPTGNQLANSQLYAVINDALNAIAVQAIDAGAVYVNTDGYIAPNTRVYMRLHQIIEDWGLTPRLVSYGPGEVSGPGSYRVGPRRTKTRYDKPHYHKTIREVQHWRWLQSRLVWARDFQGLADWETIEGAIETGEDSE